ncbi:4'-phosphopantetheinyl transferase superfamily protein [Actinomyces sp. ZJ308]|uniref:4'-phosphopantetheinyl transferase family protein n=1 Tax=Actinomyces sp. ZJ308 TaxID=2708342 RepID=UPI0014210D0E|nr:4'-phosphopantetheinyl transferase superfamily protein [Actinomyces sp. ZJ308]
MEDRRSHFLAHCLAKTMLADHVGGIDGPCSVISHESSGRPVTACGIELSISHSVSSVAVAVARSGGVGVDVEDLSRAEDMAAVRDILCSHNELRIIREEGCDEIDLLRLWVAKEALVKIGAATLDGFRRVDLSMLLLSHADGTQATGCRWGVSCGDVDLTVWRDSRCVGAVARTVRRIARERQRLSGCGADEVDAIA